MTAGAFGVVAGVAALQFFSDVPKVRTDIMQVRGSRFFGWIRDLKMRARRSKAEDMRLGELRMERGITNS